MLFQSLSWWLKILRRIMINFPETCWYIRVANNQTWIEMLTSYAHNSASRTLLASLSAMQFRSWKVYLSQFHVKGRWISMDIFPEMAFYCIKKEQKYFETLHKYFCFVQSKSSKALNYAKILCVFEWYSLPTLLANIILKLLLF